MNAEVRAEAPGELSWAASLRAPYTLALLCLAYVISMIDRQVISLLVEPIKGELAVTDTQIGLLQGFAFAVFYAVLGVPLARIADVGNRRLLVVGGLATWSLATIACGLARTFPGLFASRVAVGAGESTLCPAAYSMLADLYPQRRLGRAIGIFHMAAGIALGLALVIGSALYSVLSVEPWASRIAALELSAWRATFVAVGLPGLVLALLMLATVREPARRGVDVERGRGETRGLDAAQTSADTHVLPYLRAHRRAMLPMYAGLAIYSAFIYALLAWSPAHLSRTFGLDVAATGKQLGLVLMIAGGLGCLAGGLLTDALYARNGALAPLRALRLVGFLTILPAVWAPLAATSTLSIALLGVAFFFASAAQPLAPVALQLHAPPRLRARLSALWLCFNNLIGFGLGPLCVALLSDHVFGPAGIRWSLATTFAIALVVSALCFARLLQVRTREFAAGE